MMPPKQNYKIHDKELLAIVACVDQWRDYLKSLNLAFINHQKYSICYCPGLRNAEADALSRCPNFAEGGKASEQPGQTLLCPLLLSAMFSPASDIADLIQQHLQHDTVSSRIIQDLSQDASTHANFELANDGFLLLQGKIYVPNFELLKASTASLLWSNASQRKHTNLPSNIVSDCGTTFTLHWWTKILAMLDV
ncbi:hypothetical protein ACM66B_002495 [Microbotryomycetes sp. NB124-2]